MYLSHFGFSEWPFSNTPDPRFVYLSSRHEEALAHLLYGVQQQGGFVQLTGEVGTGKTMMCRYLVERPPDGVDVALILNPMLTPEELLATMCDELGVTYPPDAPSRKVLVDALYRHLLAAHRAGRRTVLIVDEAQNLSVEALEQLRLLTNLETTKQKLLQIILIGQPELAALLLRPELRQLAQRVTARYHLLPFAEAETRAYVRHRLAVAGCARPLFDAAALREVHGASRGVPRLINVVCDRALLGAYSERRTEVDAATVRRAGREVLEVGIRRPRRPRMWRPVAVAAVALPLALTAGAVLVAVGGGLLRWPPLGVAGRATGGEVESSVPERAAVSEAGPDAGPAGERRDAATAPTARPTLMALLAQRDLPTDRSSAFASLLLRWRVAADRTNVEPCDVAARVGLRCLEGKGTWLLIRRLDLPVVLKLSTPDGERRWVSMIALDGDEAAIELGERVFMIRLRELDAVWDGGFELVWRPPPIGTRVLSPGMRGRAVAWLSERLAELDGHPVSPTADRYDDALKARVVAFQRAQSLEADGVAGLETLMRLSVVLDRDVPSLSGALKDRREVRVVHP